MRELEQELRRRIGLDAASIGSSAIERSFRLRMKARGLKRIEDYRALLRTSRTEWQELIEAVVVTETWFFRDQEAFAALTRLMLDEWLPGQSSGRARILSMPCSSGEEPYSMAIALFEAGIPPERYEILGVDISARVLALAERGIYGRNSFRGKNLEFRERYFQSKREGFVLQPATRKKVRFLRANLLSEEWGNIYAPFDFIFCRNLLIYFDKPTQQKVLVNLSHLLGPEGLLFVGPAEQPLALEHGFVSAHIPMAFACRKAGATRALSQSASGRVSSGNGRPTTSAQSSTASQGQLGKDSRSSGDPALVAHLPHLGTAVVDLETARKLADAGRLAEAAAICQTNLRQRGASAYAYYLLGLIRDAEGGAEAEEFYRRALYLEPDHYESLLQLSLLSEKKGQTALARRFKNRAQRAKPKT